MKNLKNIASAFQTEGKITSITPLGGGFINSTFLVETEGSTPDYILQRKNKEIFRNVPAMMENIVKVSEHLAHKVTQAGGNADRNVMKVVKTPDGSPFVVDGDGEYWTMSVFIPGTVSHEVADSPRLAFKGGEGIGDFQRQLADFVEPLYPTIEGFHDLEYRFKQWDEAVKNNRANRVNDLHEEIEWIESRRDKMTAFWNHVKDGELPKRVTHNDTKLSNILFDKDDNVLCVIDLDTVMSNTVLADYGDAIRSFANTGAEDDTDLGNVGLDREMFREYTRGYLSKAAGMLNDTEKEWLAFGPLYITFEQTLRFLMDYIDGDIYYRISYPEHNLVRAKAQNRLLESMEQNFDFMTTTVDELIQSTNRQNTGI